MRVHMTQRHMKSFPLVSEKTARKIGVQRSLAPSEISLQTKQDKTKLYQNRIVRHQLLRNSRGHQLLSSRIRGGERKRVAAWVHSFNVTVNNVW